jgi:AcrR family transcriptional regulator
MDHVEDKRQAILDATLRLISKNGFHGTAMSKVAQEARVSTGIIYHYFDNKDELIDELYKAIKRKSARQCLRISTGHGRSKRKSGNYWGL